MSYVWIWCSSYVKKESVADCNEPWTPACHSLFFDITTEGHQSLHISNACTFIFKRPKHWRVLTIPQTLLLCHFHHWNTTTQFSYCAHARNQILSFFIDVAIQLGKMRLTVPCRAVTCSHLQCFDAALYLQMNEKKPTWICPVCDKKAAYESLIIDGSVHSMRLRHQKITGIWVLQSLTGYLVYNESHEVFLLVQFIFGDPEWLLRCGWNQVSGGWNLVSNETKERVRQGPLSVNPKSREWVYLLDSWAWFEWKYESLKYETKTMKHCSFWLSRTHYISGSQSRIWQPSGVLTGATGGPQQKGE